MKIKFLGVGNAFTTKDYWQSNMLLEIEGRNILFDCGTDIRFSLQEAIPSINNGNIMDHIDGVYISHIHADHCGGLEWLGFCTYFSKGDKPFLLCNPEIKDEIWQSLKGGMAQIEKETERSLETYFDVKCGKNFRINDTTFRTVKSVHVKSIPEKYSYGLFVKNNKSAYITSDIVYNKPNKDYTDADIIFHDCETTPYKSNVHAHYDDLKNMDENIKSKMWLYHYHPNTEKERDAVKDGFAGFVRKGQSFEI